MNKLSAAEVRLIECLRIAVTTRRGFGKNPETIQGNFACDYDLVLADALALAAWVEIEASKAADPEGVSLPKVASFMGDDGETYVRAKARDDWGMRPARDSREWHMTAEQVEWLEQKFGHMADSTAKRIYAFYVRASLDIGVPALPHMDECPRPCVQDQLALDDKGVVHRFIAWQPGCEVAGDLGGAWQFVSEFPGYRIERGVLHWAPGIWPPATEGKVEGAHAGGFTPGTHEEQGAASTAAL